MGRHALLVAKSLHRYAVASSHIVHSTIIDELDLRQAIHLGVVWRNVVDHNSLTRVDPAHAPPALPLAFGGSSEQRRSLKPDEAPPLLGIYIGRSASYITAVLACLAAG